MPPPLEDQLHELLDKQAIAELLYRYAEAVDRRDASLAASLFTPDAQLQYGVLEGPASRLIAMMASPKPSTFVLMHHLVGNLRIRFQAPDRAKSVAYVFAYHRARYDGPEGQILDEMLRARYLDRLVKQDGAWRFVSRTLVFDWSQVVPAQAAPWWAAAGDKALTGANAPDDPSGGFLASDD